MAIILAEWAFIFKFAGPEITTAGAVRGIDPFAVHNPWLVAWSAHGSLLFAFALLHFSPPWFRDHIFDYDTASADARKAVDLLLVVACAIPSVLAVHEIYATVGYCDPAATDVWDRCAD